MEYLRKISPHVPPLSNGVLQMDSEKCLIKKFSDFDFSWRLRHSRMDVNVSPRETRAGFLCFLAIYIYTFRFNIINTEHTTHPTRCERIRRKCVCKRRQQQWQRQWRRWLITINVCCASAILYLQRCLLCRWKSYFSSYVPPTVPQWWWIHSLETHTNKSEPGCTKWECVCATDVNVSSSFGENSFSTFVSVSFTCHTAHRKASTKLLASAPNANLKMQICIRGFQGGLPNIWHFVIYPMAYAKLIHFLFAFRHFHSISIYQFFQVFFCRDETPLPSGPKLNFRIQWIRRCFLLVRLISIGRIPQYGFKYSSAATLNHSGR